MTVSQNQAMAEYWRALVPEVNRGNATEHTHRPIFKSLVEAVCSGTTATNEPRRVACGAPDFVVETGVGPLRRQVGHIETKDVGTPLGAIEADSERIEPRTAEGRQLKRYRGALENLILTDYQNFIWYVRGVRRDQSQLTTLPAGSGLTSESTASTVALLNRFAAHAPAPVTSARELAERMAKLTRMLREVIEAQFNQNLASATLTDLHEAFGAVLIPEISTAEFVDMYVQTLAYGLFAARISHESSLGEFQRSLAAAQIPKTNPFLRRLFTTITGPDLDDEPYAPIVDDLTQLLADADIDAILEDFGRQIGREDPVVHFYETFLAAYDPDLKDLRGVYYTPSAVVSYIVRSVDETLKNEFASGLADTSLTTYRRSEPGSGPVTTETHRVLILDPSCGTGTFLYDVIKEIRTQFGAAGNAGIWSSYVREHLLPRLFGFEILMAPYAIAHLKLGLQLAALDLPAADRSTWHYDFAAAERLNVYLTNTLDELTVRSQVLIGRYLSDEAAEAAKVKAELPIMVVLGNPPYRGRSANLTPHARAVVEPYRFVDGVRIRERGALQFEKNLQNDYVKFIRFAEERVESTGTGIVGLITSHRFLKNPTLRGMRNHLWRTFDEIHVLDLHGASRTTEVVPDGVDDQPVFDIQEGVAISLFLKHGRGSGEAKVYYSELWGRREEKYNWLAANTVASTQWTEVAPEEPFYRFVPVDAALQAEFQEMVEITAVFKQHGAGVVTARDNLVVDVDKDELGRRIERFARAVTPNAQLCREFDIRLKRDWDIDASRLALRNLGNVSDHIVQFAYRPMDYRWLFYHKSLTWSMSYPTMQHLMDATLNGRSGSWLKLDPTVSAKL